MTSQPSFEVNDCRVCEAPLETVGSLGNVALTSFTEVPTEPIRMPLELKFCEDCALPQLGHNTPQDMLYGKYWYRSGLNKAIVADLSEIATYARGTHIDVGANDGTLLRASRAERKLAVDPSNIESRGFDRLKNYWEDVKLGFKADTITAVACLYDLPDPNKFVGNIQKHLARNGIFISQLMTLQPMIENNDLGNICHEHLEYYSYKSLTKLFEQNGLEIFDVQQNDMNGGSYRLFSRHLKEGSVEVPEKEYSVNDLKDFFERIEEQKRRFLQFIGEKSIVGYGASTKMATIVEHYGYSPDKIVDVNPDKVGKFTIAGAEIVPEIPDGTEYLWVFPYGFIDYFKAKEKDYHGQWITTMPRFQIQ